jgi:Circadian oscillating protein COP23
MKTSKSSIANFHNVFSVLIYPFKQPQMTTKNLSISLQSLPGKIATWFLATSLIGSAGIFMQMAPVRAQADAEKVQFVCGTSLSESGGRVPTTLAWMPDNKYAIIQWVKPMGKYWTPARRCAAFSATMQSAYQSGTLQFLTNGKVKNQNVICSATEVNGKCQTVLMTLRSEDNPLQFLSELKDVFNGRSVAVPQHSSGGNQIYIKVDLPKLIRVAPLAKMPAM